MSQTFTWESHDWSNLSAANQKAVDNFREYLRIPSTHPNVDYEPCVVFLEKIGKEIELDVSVCRITPNNPAVILTWTGTDPTLPSIMLNSHMDVVPVFEENWLYKPFNAEVDDNGNIFARGAQDAKCFGIQYLEAIRRLKQEDFVPNRTVYVTFMPEEETAGIHGMQSFVEMDDFKRLKVGFVMDEGRASVSDTLMAYYGEKRSWKFVIHCSGSTGHGSLLLDNTPGEKLTYLLEKIYKYRAGQKAKNTDDVVTVNLTMLKGGVQSNVIPAKFSMVFDVRAPVQKFDAFETDLRNWCKEAGSDVVIEDLSKDAVVKNTRVDKSNPFWMALKAAVNHLGLTVDAVILPANTDARFLRALGIPCIGFSPSRYTPKRSHNDDEYLNINVFLDGITIYKEIIAGITNV